MAGGGSGRPRDGPVPPTDVGDDEHQPNGPHVGDRMTVSWWTCAGIPRGGCQRQVGEQLGDNRDPLLVRPFVLPDSDRHEPPPSASIWPAEQTAGELPTQLLPVMTVAGGSGPDKPTVWQRRSLVLIGTVTATVMTVAGYVWLRPDDRAGNWTSSPAQSLPAAIGPATSSDAGPSVRPGATKGGTSDDGAAAGPAATTPSPRETRRSAGAGPVSAAPAPAGTSTGPSAGVTGSPEAVAPLPPINLPPEAIATGRGLLVTGDGLCLDLRDGEATDGRGVDVDDCKGTSPQRWQLNADGTLEALDMCASVAGGGTVELASCDGRTTAVWKLFDNGTLISTASGLCLTDPSAGARPGSRVIVTICAGGSNQRWSFS